MPVAVLYVFAGPAATAKLDDEVGTPQRPARCENSNDRIPVLPEFKDLDANSNGKISKYELDRAYMPGRLPSEEVIAKVDVNEDGAISQDEWYACDKDVGGNRPESN